MKGNLFRAGAWLVFAAIAAILAWRVITLNLSAYYSGRSDGPDYETALSWHGANPEALYQRGRRLMNSDAGAADTLLRRAVSANPADGRIYTALAQLLDRRGETERAAELLAIADRLAPKRDSVQYDLALFWLNKGQLDQGIEPLTLLLEARPQMRQQAYPGLLQAAESPAGRAQLAKALAASPSWWTSFFYHALKNADDPNTIRELYRLSTANGRQPDPRERRWYLAWLQQQNLWREAHSLWSETLDEQQRQALGPIYNGDFELPISDEGFGWRTPRVNGVEIATLPTYGVEGGKAARVLFQGHRLRFRHFWQYLVLTPGRYELHGRGRADNLKAEYGVQWKIQCITGDKPVLATSERFLGVSDWRKFKLEFEIPAKGCDTQALTLELFGRAPLDFEARGAAWFDDFKLQRLD